MPDVFIKVADFFDALINHIDIWIGKGLGFIIDAMDYLFRKGKTAVEYLMASTK